jgi:hypothetical protein
MREVIRLGFAVVGEGAGGIGVGVGCGAAEHDASNKVAATRPTNNLFDFTVCPCSDSRAQKRPSPA